MTEAVGQRDVPFCPTLGQGDIPFLLRSVREGLHPSGSRASLRQANSQLRLRLHEKGWYKQVLLCSCSLSLRREWISPPVKAPLMSLRWVESLPHCAMQARYMYVTHLILRGCVTGTLFVTHLNPPRVCGCGGAFCQPGLAGDVGLTCGERDPQEHEEHGLGRTFLTNGTNKATMKTKCASGIPADCRDRQS